jgi:microcystin-dependent protein
MTTGYFLAPNARWQGRDLTGQPCIDGKLYTYEADSLVPKLTYQDKDGLIPNTNPVDLDDKGEANIYWMDDALYRIILKTVNDELVYDQDNYPYVANSQDTPESETDFKSNFIRNPQFTYWTNSTTFAGIKAALAVWDYCVDDWLYSKTDATSVVGISRQTFTVGQEEVPGNPPYFLRYECSNVGGGTETNSQLYQRIKSVQTLSNKNVVPSIALKVVNAPSATVEIYLNQYFGSGGSPSVLVSTLAITANLTTSWQIFNPITDILIPSVNGKTLGTDGLDSLNFSIKFPSNQLVTIDVANAQLVAGTEIVDFEVQSQNDQFKRLDTTITEGVVPTGCYMPTILTSAPAGWVLCNDGTIGNVSSGSSLAMTRCKALFVALWTNILTASGSGPTYTPIYDSAGVLSSAGASAEADWNANKRLSLTKTLGRALCSVGAPSSGTNTGTTWALGQTTGNEQRALTLNQIPDHIHNPDPGTGGQFVFTGGTNNAYNNTGANAGEAAVNTGGILGYGGQQPLVMQPPEIFLNVMIKL